MNLSASSDYQTEGRYLQRSMVNETIDKLVFSPDDAVLDVGCGTGEETKAIAAKVKSITGIDLSKEMLAFARKNNSAPNIAYCLGDAQTVGANPDWRDRFDKVVCFYVLHLFPDTMKAFGSILDCLKPGGEALFLVGNRSTVASEAALFLNGHAKWAHYTKGYKSPLYLWGRSINEAEELLATCGWTVFLKTCLGQTARIPETEQDAYLEDLWRWALSRYEDENHEAGYVHLPIEMMVVHASKPVQR